MRPTLAALAAVPLLGAASFACAQDTAAFSWTAGAIATARLDPSDSLEHAENELELFLEAEFGGGFTTGILLTSLYQDPVDNFEYEFTFGYGGTIVGDTTWGLTYGYLLLDNSREDAHEITATLTTPLNPTTEGYFEVVYDPETEESDQEIGIETALGDRWSLFGLVGNSDRDDNIYGEIGVTYALTDAVTFEVLYEDTNDAAPLLGFSIGYAFGG